MRLGKCPIPGLRFALLAFLFLSLVSSPKAFASDDGGCPFGYVLGGAGQLITYCLNQVEVLWPNHPLYEQVIKFMPEITFPGLDPVPLPSTPSPALCLLPLIIVEGDLYYYQWKDHCISVEAQELEEIKQHPFPKCVSVDAAPSPPSLFEKICGIFSNMPPYF